MIEGSRSAAGDETGDENRYVPWWLFYSRKAMMGVPARTIEQEWIAAVEGPGASAIWHPRGEWLVLMFEGVLLRHVQSDMNYTDVSRGAVIKTGTQLADLTAGGARMLADHHSQYRPPLAVSSTGAPRVDTTSADQPVLPKPQDSTSLAISREVATLHKTAPKTIKC